MRTIAAIRLALSALSMGCALQDSSVLGVAASPSLVTTVGDTAVSIQGHTYVLPTQEGGFTETNPHSGARVTRAVVPIVVMASPGADPSGPQLSIGILGSLRKGTYRVRVPGSSASDIPEFHATLIVPRGGGGSRQYPIDRGVLTIARLDPLQGVLNLSASQLLDFPAQVVVGTTARSTPTVLTITGTIGTAISR